MKKVNSGGGFTMKEEAGGVEKICGYLKRKK